MKKSFTKKYLINIVNLLLVCFIIEIIFTLISKIPNKESNFTGIGIWLIFIVVIVYRTMKLLKIDLEKFLIYFSICFLPLFIISRYFTIFDFIEPRFYGFNKKLYSFLPIGPNYYSRQFLFWQTGVSSGFKFELNNSNLLITFFTVYPIAIFECLLKAIFPNLYIVLLVQLPVMFIKKNIILQAKN